MRVGVFYFPTDYGINIAELARALEDRGFDSLFVPEHTHIPLSRKSPFPGGGELPKRYSHTHDPFVGAGLRRGGDQEAEGRHRHPAGAAARADRHGQGHRLARPALGRPLHLRHRRRLERRRDGEPRRALRDALQADARARAGHEGALDQGRGVLPRRVREVRPASGRGPSRRSGRIRRSCWAARPTTRCAASSTIATAGSRARAAASMPPRRRDRLRAHGGEGRARSRDAHDHRVRRADGRRGAGGLRQGRHPERAAGDPRPSRDEILRYLDTIAPLAKAARMKRRRRPRPDGVPVRRRRATTGAGSICARRAASIRSGRPTGW